MAETQMVAMSHPDINTKPEKKGGKSEPIVAQIPASNVDHYKAKGWKVVEAASETKGS